MALLSDTARRVNRKHQVPVSTHLDVPQTMMRTTLPPLPPCYRQQPRPRKPSVRRTSNLISSPADSVQSGLTVSGSTKMARGDKGLSGTPKCLQSCRVRCLQMESSVIRVKARNTSACDGKVTDAAGMLHIHLHVLRIHLSCFLNM